MGQREDTFAVLRYDSSRIDDLEIDGVAEGLGQSVVDDLKRPALVVVPEVLDVFQNERGRFVIFEYVGDLKKEVALLVVVKAMLPAKAKFFGDAGDAEWLAGKSSAEDVVLGNVGNRHLVDVTMWFFAEVGLVGDL